ncbi:hypothetical protein K469DRAFT_321410 [Zopfia rhizophila CBS 207.26]|uniref:Restriction endonuclease domain-containing protein n=1 Tax=Zopfia rhizophila CBS 207.26 TaxID=1314779 RepID=A0A6A6DM60_9PEZI|nr:hypothetical protein K469DRAFT_321410 [Zopfia rhizophila CBS 207.26]
MVDGLDERVDFEDDFLQSLPDLPKRSDVHIIIPSKPDIYFGLRDPIEFAIEVSAMRTQGEIAKYVQSKMNGIKRFTPKERKKASVKIAEKSGGSFRYVEKVTHQKALPCHIPYHLSAHWPNTGLVTPL